MAGKMAVGTGYIPEFQQPKAQKQRRAEQSPLANIAVIAAVLVLVIAFTVRTVTWIGAIGSYNRAMARAEELQSDGEVLQMKLDSLSAQRRISDIAASLGMRKPDDSDVKAVHMRVSK